MILNLDAQIISFDGQVITQLVDGTDQPVTLQKVLKMILGSSHRTDESMSADDKYALMEVAYKVMSGADLTVEDVATLKKRIGLIGTPVIHWGSCKEIENQLKSGSAIVLENELKEG